MHTHPQPRRTPPMASTTVEVPIHPSFILHQTDYAAVGIDYDAGTGVLTLQWDRSAASQPRQPVFPRTLEGYSLSVVVVRLSHPLEVVTRATSLLLPPLVLGGEYTADITFTPQPSAGKPAQPNIKIKAAIRAKPTGGG